MYSRILLIHDDPIQNLINTKLIGKINVTDTLMVATNGKEAYDNYLKHKEHFPEVIFLDINMPVMDGWEFLEVLSEDHAGFKPRIFMLTSSVSPADVERSEKNNLIEGFITKPLSLEKIKFLLNESDPI